jgi:hypothetical protein
MAEKNSSFPDNDQGKYLRVDERRMFDPRSYMARLKLGLPIRKNRTS